MDIVSKRNIIIFVDIQKNISVIKCYKIVLQNLETPVNLCSVQETSPATQCFHRKWTFSYPERCPKFHLLKLQKNQGAANRPVMNFLFFILIVFDCNILNWEHPSPKLENSVEDYFQHFNLNHHCK